ncbi:DUF4329 domain-containing protein [Aestuariibius insulae]|uniref:DUF4329 domain-containing protein n=1 Tax=Aestuariibius insulae TaxID=2058287 RepID=UPI00345E5C57
MILLLCPGPALAQQADEIAYMKTVLTRIQAVSFDRNKELCGVLGRTSTGRLGTSDIHVGSYDTCLIPAFPDKLDIIATFHTHSTYSPNYASEFPSIQDIDADIANGLDGYIATPGGRLWFHDINERRVIQICSTGCLPQDPGFAKETADPSKLSYSYAEMRKLFPHH